ncbi:MAG TPA: ceramidase domain-containing protein [Actinomycetota bacterium]
MLAGMLAVTEDCEALRNGWLAQPANALSSLAFVGIGLWLLARARHAPARAAEIRLFGVAALLTGLGSVAYHGPNPAWGQWAHDVPIASGLLLAAVVNVATFTGRRRRELLAWVVGTAAIAVVVAVSPDAQRAVFAVTGAAFGLTELVAVRRHLRPWPGDPDFGLWLVVIGAFVVGVGAFFLGRIDALCDPDSPFQLHALWHVLQALAIGLYVHVAVERPHPARLVR